MCGVFQVYETRMSKPPYTLLALYCSGLSRREREVIASTLYEPPVACLPLLARRLRERCPDVRSLLDEALLLLKPLADRAFVGIDFCERSHAQVR